MKLYEITKNLMQVQDLMESEEVDAEALQDTLDSLDEAFEGKVEDVIKVIRNLESQSTALKEEAKRLNDRAKTAKNNVDRLKSYLDSQLKQSGKDKLKAGLFNLSYRKSKSIEVIDESKLAEAYLKVKYSADKTAIKKAIQDGEEVEGAVLVEKQNLQIK